MITDMWEPERDFAWLKLPHGNMPNLCAISKYGARYGHRSLVHMSLVYVNVKEDKICFVI
jgi:hypothetical protein